MKYFPKYRRGESQVGYTQRCRAYPPLVRLVPSQAVRNLLCTDILTESRDLLRQPFDEQSGKKK